MPTLITSSQDILGGAPCFAGTRVPVEVVAASLDAGIALDRIRSAWPWLTPAHILAARKWADEHGRQPGRRLDDRHLAVPPLARGYLRTGSAESGVHVDLGKLKRIFDAVPGARATPRSGRSAPAVDARKDAEPLHDFEASFRRLMPAGVVVTTAGGIAPVQVECTVDGWPLYFRARHDSWRVEIATAGDPAYWRAEGQILNADCLSAAETAALITPEIDAWRASGRSNQAESSSDE